MNDNEACGPGFLSAYAITLMAGFALGIGVMVLFATSLVPFEQRVLK